MSKINKVIYKIIIALVLTIGALNILDGIYAASGANAASSGSSAFTPSVNINSSATVTVSSSSAGLNVTPSKDGKFVKSSDPIVVSVYTNTASQVNVNMTMSSTDLTASGVGTIATLGSGSFTESTFTPDRWGYSTDGTNFSGVSTTTTLKSITSNTGNTTANTTNVYFGMKLTQATKPGTYTNTLNFAAVVAGS